MKSFLQHLEEKKHEKNPVTVDVVHGTGAGPISKFDPEKSRQPNDYFGGGAGYFTDNHTVGKTYAKGPSPHLIHAKLSMKNVFDVDHKITGNHLQRLLPKDTRKFATHAGLLNAGNMDDHDSILNKLENGEAELSGKQFFDGISEGGRKTTKARKHLQKHGYDGLRYNGGHLFGGTPHNVYIPYHTENIQINKVEKL